MSSLERKTFNILLFEDNPADFYIFKEALKFVDPSIALKLVEDGLEGSSYLKKEGKYINAVTPDLIILDLNMPKKSGHEVLKEIKVDALLRDIPVAVFSNSRSPQDREICQGWPSCRFFNKPGTFTQLAELVKEILQFATDGIK